MSESITKQDLNDLREASKRDLTLTIGEFRKEINGHFVETNGRFEKINGRFDGMQTTITANTRDIISHFHQSQGLQNERMDRMDAKLDAIVEMLTMKREMRNLIRELKAQGMVLDESKIFIA